MRMMHRLYRKNRSGFSLAELLVAVAIIGILVTISMPVFGAQMEKSRESTDLANVRSAYSGVIHAASIDDRTSEYFQRDGLYAATVSLHQKKDGWSLPEDKLNIAGIHYGDISWQGVPKANGVCKIQYDVAANQFSISWGAVGNANYLNAVSPYQNQTLMDLKAMDKDARVAADQTTLKALGEEILKQGWTKAQLEANLGILKTGEHIRIADYYQKKNGTWESYTSDGFRLDGKDTLLGLLDAIGYDGGNHTQSTIGNGNTSVTYEKSLFFSDELATNNFKAYDISATKRSIILSDIKTDSNGVITGLTIYSKAMDNQANMDDREKKKFSLTVTRS